MRTRHALARNSCLCVALAVFMVGCDTVDSVTIRVVPPLTVDKATYRVSVADRDALEKIIASAAARFHLEDEPDTAPSRRIVASLRDDKPIFPVEVRAVIVGDSIVIEISRFHSGASESWAFMAAKDWLLKELKQRFGDRVSIAPRRDSVYAELRRAHDPMAVLAQA